MAEPKQPGSKRRRGPHTPEARQKVTIPEIDARVSAEFEAQRKEQERNVEEEPKKDPLLYYHEVKKIRKGKEVPAYHIVINQHDPLAIRPEFALLEMHQKIAAEKAAEARAKKQAKKKTAGLDPKVWKDLATLLQPDSQPSVEPPATAAPQYTSFKRGERIQVDAASRHEKKEKDPYGSLGLTFESTIDKDGASIPFTILYIGIVPDALKLKDEGGAKIAPPYTGEALLLGQMEVTQYDKEGQVPELQERRMFGVNPDWREKIEEGFLAAEQRVQPLQEWNDYLRTVEAPDILSVIEAELNDKAQFKLFKEEAGKCLDDIQQFKDLLPQVKTGLDQTTELPTATYLIDVYGKMRLHLSRAFKHIDALRTFFANINPDRIPALPIDPNRPAPQVEAPTPAPTPEEPELEGVVEDIFNNADYDPDAVPTPEPQASAPEPEPSLTGKEVKETTQELTLGINRLGRAWIQAKKRPDPALFATAVTQAEPLLEENRRLWNERSANKAYDKEAIDLGKNPTLVPTQEFKAQFAEWQALHARLGEIVNLAQELERLVREFDARQPAPQTVQQPEPLQPDVITATPPDPDPATVSVDPDATILPEPTEIPEPDAPTTADPQPLAPAEPEQPESTASEPEADAETAAEEQPVPPERADAPSPFGRVKNVARGVFDSVRSKLLPFEKTRHLEQIDTIIQNLTQLWGTFPPEPEKRRKLFYSLQREEDRDRALAIEALYQTYSKTTEKGPSVYKRQKIAELPKDSAAQEVSELEKFKRDLEGIYLGLRTALHRLNTGKLESNDIQIKVQEAVINIEHAFNEAMASIDAFRAVWNTQLPLDIQDRRAVVRMSDGFIQRIPINPADMHADAFWKSRIDGLKASENSFSDRDKVAMWQKEKADMDALRKNLLESVERFNDQRIERIQAAWGEMRTLAEQAQEAWNTMVKDKDGNAQEDQRKWILQTGRSSSELVEFYLGLMAREKKSGTVWEGYLNNEAHPRVADLPLEKQEHQLRDEINRLAYIVHDLDRIVHYRGTSPTFKGEGNKGGGDTSEDSGSGGGRKKKKNNRNKGGGRGGRRGKP